MDPRLDYAQELEQRDAEVAERVERIAELGRRADDLGGRAELVDADLAHLPERRQRVQAAAHEAESELAGARAALADADRELSRAPRDAGDVARHRRLQAETELRAVEERHARLRARLVELDEEEERLHRESGELSSLARGLAVEVEREPRIASSEPPSDDADLAALREWSSRAHAAVLVARTGLEAERDRIVREANELATSILGESVPAMGAAAVRERLARSI